MANQPNYSTTIPVTGAGVGGHSHPGNYSNVTLTGGAGLTYTTATGVNPIWSTAAAPYAPYYNKQPKVQITDSDIEIDGLSLHKTLITMHERMAIMQPNPALEKEFDELKECADRYRELEKKFLDQKAVWDTLKKP